MRAAIYSRVSHEEQVEGWSLDAQHELCLALVNQRGWTVAPQHIHFEPGRSAKTDARPAFQRMMRQAQARQLDYIIVHKLDRFSRSLKRCRQKCGSAEESGCWVGLCLRTLGGYHDPAGRVHAASVCTASPVG